MVGLFVHVLLLYLLTLFSHSSQSENSFGLAYDGGRIMTDPISVSLLWFGDGWQESGKETITIRNAIKSLTSSRYSNQQDDVPTLANWWDVIRQYRDGSNIPVAGSVDVGSECFYTGPQIGVTFHQVREIGMAVFNRTMIDELGGNLSCSNVFKANENTIYQIVFSGSVMFVDGTKQRVLIDLCSGDFPVNISSKEVVKMSWARAPMEAADQCSLHVDLHTPNGDEKVDSLVGYLLAKIADEATNRDGRGWISNDGNGSISSLCTSHSREENFPLYRDDRGDIGFNVIGLNGYRHIARYLWDQNIKNCALKLSEACSKDAIIFKQPWGHLSAGIIVNHSDGLQPYMPNQQCHWEISFPKAKVISFNINSFSDAADSDESLLVCRSSSSNRGCTSIDTTKENFKNFIVMGSKAYIKFVTGDSVSFHSREWELNYAAGLCHGDEDIYQQSGTIGYNASSYNASSSLSYIPGLNCRYILHGKPGTWVSLNFTLVDISKDLDFVAIYSNSTMIANFTGSYPIYKLPQMNLTGEIIVVFSTQTNGGKGWLANYYVSSPANHSKGPLLTFIIIVSAVLVISFSFAVLAFVLLKRRKQHVVVTYSYPNLILTGNRFRREENKIGEGPSAVVYKAELTDGRMVAVKSSRYTGSTMNLEEEILLKSFPHPNIISLMGYAQDGSRRRCMVFEFMSRGSLSYNLRENGESLDWEKRLAVALQISSAMQMLHMYINPSVYHGNITADNILLDELWTAKLGGFGVANYCSSNAPESMESSEMAEDIWSFGLLLIELLRGDLLENRNAYRNFHSLEEINELVGGEDCFDRRLGTPKGDYKKMALVKFGEIAKWCIGSSLKTEGEVKNPKIGDILSGLQQVKQMFYSDTGSEV